MIWTRVIWIERAANRLNCGDERNEGIASIQFPNNDSDCHCARYGIIYREELPM